MISKSIEATIDKINKIIEDDKNISAIKTLQLSQTVLNLSSSLAVLDNIKNP